MKFKFENLGVIKEAEIEIGNLTVICGKNNTGKTYLSYAVWGILVGRLGLLNQDFEKILNIEEILQKLNSNEKIAIDLGEIEDKIQLLWKDNILQKFGKINRVFDLDTKDFSNTKLILDENLLKIHKDKSIEYDFSPIYADLLGSILTIKRNEDDLNAEITLIDLAHILNEIIYDLTFFSTVLFTAQRESIILFKNAIDSYNSNVIRKVKYQESTNLDRFPLPIDENLNFFRRIPKLSARYNRFSSSITEEIEKILNIEFKVVENEIYIKELSSNNQIPLYASSSSIRQLVGIHYFIKYIANKDQLLMIDEPELGLHPENQRKIARLLVKLVNAGVKVWITTHSDYIIKELNNLIMLGNVSNKDEMFQQFGYTENDILKADDLRAYIAYTLPEGGAKVKKVEVDKYGMVESTFDDTINEINTISKTLGRNIE
jgi:predicted ATPase